MNRVTESCEETGSNGDPKLKHARATGKEVAEMLGLKRVLIRSFEYGMLFRDGEFRTLLAPGIHWLIDPFQRTRVQPISQREARLVHEQLDLMITTGALEGRATVLDLKDDQRALVWIDGRFTYMLGPGVYAFWTGLHEVRTEVIRVRQPRFEHAELATITRQPSAKALLDLVQVQRDRLGVLFVDGRLTDVLRPGLYAFWKGLAEVRVVEVDQRETVIDIGGQEIMTADKVTLRLNALVNCRVVDAAKALGVVDDYRQAIYREAQMALRAVVGTRELDQLLINKDVVVQELTQWISARALALGVQLLGIGIRDVILPGEMKELMNKVTEAKKGAEANLIARREETAAMRSQANTAKLLADNPTLMRLRELEVLEKIAANGKLNVVLGERGLADRIVNLL